jgi:hypothetical protein
MSSVNSASVFLVGFAGPVALRSPRTEVMRFSESLVVGLEGVVVESAGAVGEDAVGIGWSTRPLEVPPFWPPRRPPRWFWLALGAP